MQLSDITIVIPTRGRREQIAALLASVRSFRVILVCDADRLLIDLPSDSGSNTQVVEVVPCSPRCGSVKAMEVGMLHVSTSHALILNDDVSITEKDIREAVAVYSRELGDRPGVVALNHGPNWAHIACFPLIAMAFFLEHIAPCSYRRYGVDNEWTEKARLLGVYAKAENAHITHHWPDKDIITEREDLLILRQRMAAFRTMHRQRKIFIGIPVYGAMPAQFVNSLMAFIAAQPITADLRMKQGDSLVTRARNSLTKDFLESDCTHLLFIDCDLAFTVADILRITSHAEDVVGGVYPLKTEGELQWCGNGALEDAKPVREDGLQELRYIGTGFMCVAREVFLRILLTDGPQIEYTTDDPSHRTEYDFWRVGVRPTADKRRRYLSEDWYFCQRWLELGGKVYADTRVTLQHEGRAVWPLLSQREALMQRAEAGNA